MTRYLCLAALLVFCGWARGDDFTDRVKALEAKTAARKQDKHDPAGDPFAPANAAKKGCGCASPADCTCPAGTCDCPACAARKKAAKAAPCCSPACTCGCNEGGPCGCATLPAPQAAYAPRQAPIYYAPAFRGFVGSGGCGGGS